MTLPNMIGSTPAALPTEGGGGTTNSHLQWVQRQLDAHSEKLAGFERKLGDAVDSINALSKEEAERATKLAVIENNVSHIRDAVTRMEQSQVTEAALLSLQNQMLTAMHSMQTELAAQVVAAREKAADDLRRHEERARADRRWIMRLLVGIMTGIAGLAVKLFS